jgi:L-rhamnose mutarotase
MQQTSSTFLFVATFSAGLAAYILFLKWDKRLADGKRAWQPAPRRFGGAIKLKPKKYFRYRELHDNVWDSVLDRMYKSGIRNFTIYYHSETTTMFQSFEWVGHWNQIQPLSKEKENALFHADMKALSDDPVVRKWWKECEPCQEPFSQWDDKSGLLSDGGSGDWWAPLECVNHCGHWPSAYSEEKIDPDFLRMSSIKGGSSDGL